MRAVDQPPAEAPDPEVVRLAALHLMAVDRARRAHLSMVFSGHDRDREALAHKADRESLATRLDLQTHHARYRWHPFPGGLEVALDYRFTPDDVLDAGPVFRPRREE